MRTEQDRTRRSVSASVLAAIALAAVVAVLPVTAAAQSSDPELICAPETVTGGTTVSCRITGVAASRSVTLELRDGAAVLASADSVADPQGRATVDLVVPLTTPGTLTVVLAGTALELPLTVAPARPSGVSAGFDPSATDVHRILPAAMVLTLAAALAGASAPGLRRRGRTGGSAA